MAEMRDIPGTPDWIKAGLKSNTTNQPVAQQQPETEEKKENVKTTADQEVKKAGLKPLPFLI